MSLEGVLRSRPSSYQEDALLLSYLGAYEPLVSFEDTTYALRKHCNYLCAIRALC